MTDDDDESGVIEVTIDGVTYRADYDAAADGNVYLRYPGYAKAPAKLLPTGAEATARWMLKELIQAIKIGTAKKSAGH